MSEKDLAQRCAEHILANDMYSRWAGIEMLDIGDGTVTLQMTVRPEMVNGFGMCHGGITFSLADSALALACNSTGKITVALEVNISYTMKAVPGDVLTARAERASDTRRIGVYNVTVTNQREETVAIFRGTVYKTEKPLIQDDPEKS